MVRITVVEVELESGVLLLLKNVDVTAGQIAPTWAVRIDPSSVSRPIAGKPSSARDHQLGTVPRHLELHRSTTASEVARERGAEGSSQRPDYLCLLGNRWANRGTTVALTFVSRPGGGPGCERDGETACQVGHTRHGEQVEGHGHQEHERDRRPQHLPTSGRQSVERERSNRVARSRRGRVRGSPL